MAELEYVDYETEEYKRRVKEYKDSLKEEYHKCREVNFMGIKLRKLNDPNNDYWKLLNSCPKELLPVYDWENKKWKYPKL